MVLYQPDSKSINVGTMRKKTTPYFSSIQTRVKSCSGRSPMGPEMGAVQDRLLYMRGLGGTRHLRSNVTFRLAEIEDSRKATEKPMSEWSAGDLL